MPYCIEITKIIESPCVYPVIHFFFPSFGGASLCKCMTRVASAVRGVQVRGAARGGHVASHKCAHNSILVVVLY